MHGKSEAVEALVDESVKALATAILIDFPAESKKQREKVRKLVKEVLDRRLAELMVRFMLEDIIPILMHVKSEEETDAG